MKISVTLKPPPRSGDLQSVETERRAGVAPGKRRERGLEAASGRDYLGGTEVFDTVLPACIEAA